MSDLELTFLGTATSIGVPSIGCDCETCTSDDPRDQRFRSSVHIKTPECEWIVDAGPDLRSQCLREKISHLDAVLITHSHVDHIVGFDDLRRFTFGMDVSLPVYASSETHAMLRQMFEYLFNGRNVFPGYFKPDSRTIDGPFTLGETEVTPLPVEHGRVKTLGFLFSRDGSPRLAYIPDAKMITAEAMSALRGVDTLIIDALRPSEHPTHMNFEEAQAVAQMLNPRQTWFTHFSCNVKHTREEAGLPPNIRLAFDGLRIRV